MESGAKHSYTRSYLLLSAALLLVLALTGVFLWLLLRQGEPAVSVKSLPEGWPASRRLLSDRFRAALPLWFWRLKGSVLGPVKTIQLEAEIIDCGGLAEVDLTDSQLGEPQFKGTNGLQVWIAGDEEIRRLRSTLEHAPGNAVVSRARFATAHGIQANLYTGETVPVGGVQTAVGLRVEMLPRLHRKSTDLSTVMTFSELATNSSQIPGEGSSPSTLSVRTNLAVAARMQMPKGTGVFLLDGGSNANHPRRLGVIISAQRPDWKK